MTMSTHLHGTDHTARMSDVPKVSVGVDLVEVSRLARLAAQPLALSGVLTDRELEYCCSKPRRAEHIAARFAGKEAVLKALGTGLAEGVRWTDVEILADARGTPTVGLSGVTKDLAARRDLRAIHVSLSHTKQLATAHAVAVWASASVSLPTDSLEPLMSITPQMRSLDDVPPDRRRGGEVRVLLSPRTVGSTSGFMGMATLAPGERIAEHLHPHSEEFLCVITGAITAELDGVAYPLRRREGLLIPPHVRHRLVNASAETAEVVFHLGPLAPRPELGHIDTETDGGPGTVAAKVG